MPAYDIHQHLWPEPYVDVLRRRRTPPRIVDDRLELEVEGASPFDAPAHTLAGRIDRLDHDGIDVGVISLPPTLETERVPAEESNELIQAYHAGILDAVAESNGRLVALAVNSCREGFVGASVGASALIDRPDWLEPLLRDLETRQQILFVHPGVPASPEGRPRWWSAVVEYTTQMQAAYASWLAWGKEEHPHVPVVFAILAGGAPIQLERLRSRGVDFRAAIHPNVYFDTASYGRHALELAMSLYGVGQILYGSDVPVIDAAPMLEEVSSFGEAVKRAVCSENPTRLLGSPTSTPG